MTDLDKVVSKIETLVSRKTPILVAIDGRSGAGKSTISKKIAGQVNGTVVVGDVFFQVDLTMSGTNYHKKKK